MKLVFKQAYQSIKTFDSVELPEFTVLTGRNGSGKTQLLKAIELGRCELESVPLHSIKYFSGSDFKLGDQKSVARPQALQRFSQILNVFNGKGGTPKINYRNTASQIWNSKIAPHAAAGQILENVDLTTFSLFEKSEDHVIEGLLEAYRSEIVRGVFEPLASHLDGYALSTAAQKSPGPVHNLQQTTHFQNFVPETSNRGILNTSLGSLFAQYKIDQYNWVRDQIEEKDSPKKFSELYLEFEERHRKPWDVVNELFERMNTHSPDKNVFSFEITNPNDQVLKHSNVEAFAFSPQVTDRKTGAVFGFESLSSGEAVLAALSVSLLEMEIASGRPKLLLFDEIEASLHPSMINALLETLRLSFIDNGTSIIMATHSPTTVALVDPASLFLVEPKAPSQKVRKTDQSEAISILTEGVATIADAKVIFQSLAHPVNILTEGNNVVHLKRLIALSELKGIGVIEGLEDRSGKTQIKTHAELLNCVKPKQIILIVLDSDAKKQFQQIEESDTVKKFIFKKNPNGYPCTGIENMFDRSLLEPFLHSKTISEFGKTIEHRTLEDHSKRNFEQHILDNGKLEDFAHFEPLLEKVAEISG